MMARCGGGYGRNTPGRAVLGCHQAAKPVPKIISALFQVEVF
jgi:hypothetical protein